MRWIVAAVLVWLVAAAPAAAQETPGPTLLTFDRDISTPDAAFTPSETCTPRRMASLGRDGGPYANAPCSPVHLQFAKPQRIVEFFVRVPKGSEVGFDACAGSACIDTQVVSGTGEWVPVVLAAKAAAIDNVSSFSRAEMGVQGFDMDDIAYSIFDPAKVTTTVPGGVTQGSGNLNVDPLFTDAANGNFALSAGSPAIDSGDPAGLAVGDGLLTDDESATDRAGNPRIADGNDDGHGSGGNVYELRGAGSNHDRELQHDSADDPVNLLPRARRGPGKVRFERRDRRHHDRTPIGHDWRPQLPVSVACVIVSKPAGKPYPAGFFSPVSISMSESWTFRAFTET
jgi:hypothetical protein